LFIYALKGVREISDSQDSIYFKCLKCDSELIGHKGYGKLRILCKCGNAATVYTGVDIHFKSDLKDTKKRTVITDAEKIRGNDKSKIEIFKKHIHSDFMYLSALVSKRRDLTKQVSYEQCLNLADEIEHRDWLSNDRDKYIKISKYLQKFCNLESVSINIVWEPLLNQNTLSTIANQTHIIGTTYPLLLNSIVFYTVYLNPEFLTNSEILIAAIAHELSHIYAFHNNIRFTSPDNDRGNKEYNEQMTDLLGIVLGMGELMHAYASLNKNESHNTGYLTNAMICDAYKLWTSEYLPGKK